MAFFLLGIIAAIIPSRGKSFLAILSVLFVFFIIIPAVKSAIIEKTVEGLPSSFKLYSDKIKIANDFENRIEKKYGKFNKGNMEVERKIIKGYWNKEYKEIMALEKDILNRFSRVVEINNSLSLITPVEVYHSTCHSASSRGYENFLEFFKYLIQLRRDFLRFYIERVYYNDPKILVSFVKGDENLFHAIPRLPGNFLSGVLANLAWTVLLIIAGYILFEKYLYTPENKNPLKEKELEFKLRKNKINTLSSRKTIIRDKLYLYFSGQTGKNKYSEPNLRLIHGDQPLTVPTNNKGFVYICDPCEISGDIKAKDFISFVCKSNGVSRTEISGIIKSLSPDTPVNEYLRKLEPEQRADVLLSVIPYIKGSVYVVDDMYRYLTLPIMIKLKDQLDALVKRGALVIYLAKENRIDPNRADRDIEVINLPEWFDVIEANRFQLRNGGGELKK